MEKMVKKNRARAMIPPSERRDKKSVSTRICIDLTLFSERNGLNKRNVRRPEAFGMYYSKSDTITTMKSSQFQASFRYAFFPMKKPQARIFITHSMKKATVKYGSNESSHWFHSVSLYGSR